MTISATAPVVIDINLPFGVTAAFHCPLCGINLEEPDENGDPRGCPHLLFSFLESESLLVHVAPDIQPRLDAVDEADEEDDEPLLTRYVNAVAERSMVVFRLSSGGMACGPVWSTMAYAFDFRPTDSAPSEQHR